MEFNYGKFLETSCIHSSSDATSYLNSEDSTKSLNPRLLSYLICLGRIPQYQNEWEPSLRSLINNYWEIANKCQFTPEYFSASLPSIITRDVGRSIHVFSQMLADIGCDAAVYPDANLRILRIFYVLTQTIPNYNYIQGHDQFVYNAILIAVSSLKDQGEYFIESLAFHLSELFLTKFCFSEIVLGNIQNPLYESATNVIERVDTKLAASLRKQKLTPDFYALNWMMLLFAEQHPFRDLMIVWDQFVLHIEDDVNFVGSLIYAHIKQIPLANDKFSTLQIITNKNDYNLQTLLEDIKQSYQVEQKEVAVPTKAASYRSIVIASLTVMIVLVLLFLFK